MSHAATSRGLSRKPTHQRSHQAVFIDGAPWVELFDRGEAVRPRYVVRASGLPMAGEVDCFVAAMEFASRVARLSGCTAILRQAKDHVPAEPTADRPVARSPSGN